MSLNTYSEDLWSTLIQSASSKVLLAEGDFTNTVFCHGNIGPKLPSKFIKTRYPYSILWENSSQHISLHFKELNELLRHSNYIQ